MQAALVDLEDVEAMLLMGFTELLPVECGRQWFGIRRVSTDTKGPVANHICPNWTRLKYKIHWRGDWHEFDLRPCPDIRGVIFDLDGVDGYGRITLSSLGRWQTRRACPLINRLTTQ